MLGAFNGTDGGIDGTIVFLFRESDVTRKLFQDEDAEFNCVIITRVYNNVALRLETFEVVSEDTVFLTVVLFHNEAMILGEELSSEMKTPVLIQPKFKTFNGQLLIKIFLPPNALATVPREVNIVMALLATKRIQQISSVEKFCTSPTTGNVEISMRTVRKHGLRSRNDHIFVMNDVFFFFFALGHFWL